MFQHELTQTFLSSIYVMGEWVEVNGTTRVPKSVPCLVLDKVRLKWKRSFYAQACSIDIWFIEWMLPLWIPFETNIQCYFSMKYLETGDIYPFPAMPSLLVTTSTHRTLLFSFSLQCSHCLLHWLWGVSPICSPLYSLLDSWACRAVDQSYPTSGRLGRCFCRGPLKLFKNLEDF